MKGGFFVWKYMFTTTWKTNLKRHSQEFQRKTETILCERLNYGSKQTIHFGILNLDNPLFKIEVLCVKAFKEVNAKSIFDYSLWLLTFGIAFSWSQQLVTKWLLYLLNSTSWVSIKIGTKNLLSLLIKRNFTSAIIQILVLLMKFCLNFSNMIW